MSSEDTFILFMVFGLALVCIAMHCAYRLDAKDRKEDKMEEKEEKEEKKIHAQIIVTGNDCVKFYRDTARVVVKNDGTLIVGMDIVGKIASDDIGKVKKELTKKNDIILHKMYDSLFML